MIFDLWIPYLPPSSNKIYIRHPKGMGKILSGDARKFKIDAMRAIQEAGRVAFMSLKNNVPYELRLAFFLDTVENKNSKAGERFKQIDLSNRVKLIEDTISEATGIDDRHNFRIVLEKHCDPKNTGIYITLAELNEEEVGLTKERYELRQRELDGTGGALSKRTVPFGTQRTGERSTDQIDQRGNRPRQSPHRSRRR